MKTMTRKYTVEVADNQLLGIQQFLTKNGVEFNPASQLIRTLLDTGQYFSSEDGWYVIEVLNSHLEGMAYEGFGPWEAMSVPERDAVLQLAMHTLINRGDKLVCPMTEREFVEAVGSLWIYGPLDSRASTDGRDAEVAGDTVENVLSMVAEYAGCVVDPTIASGTLGRLYAVLPEDLAERMSLIQQHYGSHIGRDFHAIGHLWLSQRASDRLPTP